MAEALNCIFNDDTVKTRVSFLTIRTDKYGSDKMKNAGSIVGLELSKRPVRHENGGLVLEY
jgi:hypothetical protein